MSIDYTDLYLARIRRADAVAHRQSVQSDFRQACREVFTSRFGCACLGVWIAVALIRAWAMMD